jgi:predicted type IV restriction endonuclease
LSFEKSLENLERLEQKYSNTNQNEANTRFQIIDKILKNTFFWPDSNIYLEEKTNEGYSDYRLTDNQNRTYLIIEAKKEKINFNFSQYSEIRNNKIKVKLLMKDVHTANTINQVKNYCNDIGCNYACITNGHEWAFFRTFIDGKGWQEGNAYIISSLKAFIENFNEINAHLTYNKIVKEYSFNKLFDGIEYSSNERYEPKLQINGYTEQIQNNHIETKIKGYFDKYFGEIRDIDKELLEECYVEERGYVINFDKVTNLLEDAISPYMIQKQKLQNIEINGINNSFSDEILEIIIKEKKSKVLILFGGKGSGKSTFLVSLFNNKRNLDINKHSVISRVNLLKISNDKESIKKEIFAKLVKTLDVDNLLNGTNEKLINLFRDKFEIELQQSLSGLDEKSESFILKRNELLTSYKKDEMYCLIRLSDYLRTKQKAIIINIDNTDQFDQSLQDYCFSLANEISQKLHCICIISLREERYVTSTIEGYLDAYEKNGFHISSPNPQQVFIKRLNFIQNKINNENRILEKEKDDINILFKILNDNLLEKESEFNKFMTAATHGNIRQGLDLFKNYLFSNYTNVNEMILQKKWKITLHQILKPIMIPIYRYYDEKISNSIPNIFRLRSNNNSSHFTAYRILNKLAIKNDTYTSIYELKSYFIDVFNMEDDFILNIDLLLKRGMIESENGLDKYSEQLQKIKISSFGYYMQDTIFKDFAYLELISSDLSVVDKQFSNEIITFSNKEYALLKKAQNETLPQNEDNDIRYKRIEIRISKVDKLCDYLKEQETLEMKKYSITCDYLISNKIIHSFNEQKFLIRKSAISTLSISREIESNKHGIKKLD